MNSGIIGKIICFWVFMIGGLFAARIFGFAGDATTLIWVLVLCAILYVAFIIAQSKGKRRAKDKNRAANPAANGKLTGGKPVGGQAGVKAKKKKK